MLAIENIFVFIMGQPPNTRLPAWGDSNQGTVEQQERHRASLEFTCAAARGRMKWQVRCLRLGRRQSSTAPLGFGGGRTFELVTDVTASPLRICMPVPPVPSTRFQRATAFRCAVAERPRAK